MRRTGGLLETGKILYLPAAQIRPNPGQPRKIFDPAGLQELAGEHCGIRHRAAADRPAAGRIL